MPRMRILSKVEQEQFETPPVFDSRQRKTFLEFPKQILETAQTFRKTDNKIGFLMACGYFNSAKRFFTPKDYHQTDIETMARILNVEHHSFDAASYPARTRQRHEYIILEFYGFKRFENAAETLLSQEIGTMVCAHPKPRLVFERCLDVLVQNRIQLPSSRGLTDLVRIGLNQHKTRLSKLVETSLSDKTRKLLEELFNRLIKNAIICWNYLYLTKKLRQAKTEEDRQHLLKSILTHSVVSWAHINMLGEYDFSDEKLRDSVGILPPKIAA